MNDPRLTPVPRRLLLLSAGGTILLSACSASDSTALPERLERIKPSDAPITALVPGTVPIDYRTIRGEGFRVSVPASWKDSQKATGPKTPPAYLLDAQGRPPEAPVRVGVVIDTDPKSDSIEQSQVLVVAKTAAGAQNIRRSLIDWPGTMRTVLVDWSEAAGGSGGAEYRTRQLMAQVSANKIINVVATAPTVEFDSLPLNEILSTFVVEA